MVLLIAAPSAGATDIDVNSNMDVTIEDDLCTVREAINAANSNMAQFSGGAGPDCPAGQAAPDMDRILLDGNTQYLLAGAANDDANVSGDLDVDGGGPVTIQGVGSPPSTIDANDVDRVIHARDTTVGDTLTIDGVGIQDGDPPTGGGGGVLVIPSASLTLTDSLVRSNLAGGGTGLHNGGGIRVDGALNMLRSVVFNNDANSTDLTATGGGIEVSLGATANITDSVIDLNSATTSANAAINGGGINNANGDVVLRNSTVSNNLVASGSVGSQRGAGVVAVLSDNMSSFVAVNSTISGNTIVTGGQAGGIYAPGPGTVDLIHTTVTNNSVGGAGQGDAVFVQNVTDFDVRASILDGADAADVCGTAAGGAITSEGHNVAPGATCALTAMGDAQGVSPMLGPLATNSGPLVGAPGAEVVLRTHAVAAGTPPFDRVPAANCTDELSMSLVTDQRGFARPSPVGGSCDSGAFELTVALPVVNPPVTTPAAPVAPRKKKCKKKKRRPAAAAKKCKRKKKR